MWQTKETAAADTPDTGCQSDRVQRGTDSLCCFPECGLSKSQARWSAQQSPHRTAPQPVSHEAGQARHTWSRSSPAQSKGKPPQHRVKCLCESAPRQAVSPTMHRHTSAIQAERAAAHQVPWAVRSPIQSARAARAPQQSPTRAQSTVRCDPPFRHNQSDTRCAHAAKRTEWLQVTQQRWHSEGNVQEESG